jgi:hypothetical protein
MDDWRSGIPFPAEEIIFTIASRSAQICCPLTASYPLGTDGGGGGRGGDGWLVNPGVSVVLVSLDKPMPGKDTKKHKHIYIYIYAPVAGFAPAVIEFDADRTNPKLSSGDLFCFKHFDSHSCCYDSAQSDRAGENLRKLHPVFL